MMRLRSSLVVLALVSACGGDHAGSDFDGGHGSDGDSALDGAISDGTTNDGSTIDGATPDGSTIELDAMPDAPIVIDDPADGVLDPDFGSGGTVVSGVTGRDRAMDLAIQPDGKVVVVGEAPGGMLILRYTPDGDPDPAFGTQGRVVVSAGQFGGAANAVVLLPDGKILVAGQAYVGGYPQIALARLSSTGVLDPTFGTNGVALPLVGGGAGGLTPSASASDVAVRSDGLIVVAGYKTELTNGRGLVARLTSTGALDTTFGTSGTTTLTFQSGGGFARLALDASNRIAVAGVARYSYSTGSGSQWWLARFTADGALDTTFNGGHFSPPFPVTDATATDIALQPDGKLVSVGWAYQGPTDGADYALYRTGSDGAYDPGFGSLGRQWFAPIGISSATAYAVALQTNGAIVLAGHGYAFGTGQQKLVVSRRAANGTSDGTFGSSGTLAFPIGSGNPQARALAVGATGAIYVAGWVTTGSEDDVFLARIN